jgi:hypothetical protein
MNNCRITPTADPTSAIQKAIDEGSPAGRIISIAPGTYRCGTIILRSNIALQLEPGATIVGSDNIDDYRKDVDLFVDAVGHTRGRTLFYAKDAENVTVEGYGTIDGNGGAFPPSHPNHLQRPFLMRLVDCKRVKLLDITIKNSAAWNVHLLGCEDVSVRGVTIYSWVNGNNDGIDIDGCRRIRITDCDISTGDDAICLKATTAKRPCTDVMVSNCVLKSECGAIKLGTESIGDMKNINITDCVIYDTGMCGIKILSTDGSHMEDINISNITMHQVTGPIFIKLGDRGRLYDTSETARPAGVIKNVSISNIMATLKYLHKINPQAYVQAGLKEQSGILITGMPGHCIENLTLSNISTVFKGGGTLEESRNEVPERIKDYPEHTYFGVLPSYGMFIRHARNVVMDNIRMTLSEPDCRPAMVIDDVEDMDMSRFSAAAPQAPSPLVKLKNSSRVRINGKAAESDIS